MLISILSGVLVCALIFFVGWCFDAELSKRGEDLGTAVLLSVVCSPTVAFIVFALLDQG